MELDSLPIACYGKLPSDREYVHHQTGDLAVEGFDTWVRNGHRQAFLGRSGSLDGYDRAPAFGVVFSTSANRPLWAVLKASRDATGRRYPFWVAWPPPAPDHPLSPAAFRNALGFVEAATQGDLEPSELGDHVPQMTGSSPRSGDGAPPDASSMEAFLEAALPADAALSPRQFLATWMGVFAGRSPGDLTALNYGLQLPLPAGTDPVAAADYWRTATRRIVGASTLPVSLFWSLPAADAAFPEREPGALQLFLKSPPPQLYAHLFAPDRDPSFIYAPARTTPDHADDTMAVLPARHRRLLDDLSRSPAAFLDALGR
jgi:type VI secretion system ImpM family protein